MERVAVKDDLFCFQRFAGYISVRMAPKHGAEFQPYSYTFRLLAIMKGLELKDHAQ